MVAFPRTRFRLLDFSIGRNRLLAEGGRRWCPGCQSAPLLSSFPSNAANRTGRASICATCDTARCAARDSADRTAANARHQRWRDANLTHVRSSRRASTCNRRARIREAFVEAIDPAVLYERDAGICGVCSEPVAQDSFEVDHVVPLALGGEHSYANTQVAHAYCNRSKGGRLGAEITNMRSTVA